MLILATTAGELIHAAGEEFRLTLREFGMAATGVLLTFLVIWKGLSIWQAYAERGKS